MSRMNRSRSRLDTLIKTLSLNIDIIIIDLDCLQHAMQGALSNEEHSSQTATLCTGQFHT